MAAVSIHTAQPDEAGIVAELLCDFNREFGTPTPPQADVEARARQLMASGDVVVLLGRSRTEGSDGSDRPEALALMTFRSTVWGDGPVAMLEELYVVPDRRGQGIGRAMMEAVLERARAASCPWIALLTGETDHAARNLYESVGFTNVEVSHEAPRMLYYELEL